MSSAQKNPRRTRGLTGIYANKSKLKYGRGGIRTLDRVAPISVFKTDALNHSATLPHLYSINFLRHLASSLTRPKVV